MSAATITSKGQITIPKDIRDNLKLKSGDRVNFFIDEVGYAIFMPAANDITSLKGIVPKPETPVSIEEMDAVIKSKAGKL